MFISLTLAFTYFFLFRVTRADHMTYDLLGLVKIMIIKIEEIKTDFFLYNEIFKVLIKVTQLHFEFNKAYANATPKNSCARHGFGVGLMTEHCEFFHFQGPINSSSPTPHPQCSSQRWGFLIC